MSKRLTVSMDDVIADPRYQPRQAMSDELVIEYAEQMKQGDAFPPVKVIRLASDGKYYIADGFHRYRAHRELKRKKIDVELIKDNGTHLDVLMECVQANHGHGLRRTNADKQRAIEMILSEPAYQTMGKDKIAKLARVSKPMVIDFIRQRSGLQTTSQKRAEARSQGVSTHAKGVDSTPLTENLTKAQKRIADFMKAAGTPQTYIEATMKRWIAENAQKPKPERRRRTDIERLELLADKLARSRNVVIELGVKDATPRTKQFVKVAKALKKDGNDEM